MADNDTQAAEPQGQPAEGPKTFTQDEVNKLMGDLRAKERAKYAGFEEYKAKAEQFDKAEEDKKSELEKALESANQWKAKAEQMEAAEKRRAEIHAQATAYKVDAALLERMAGDVEENARFLAETLSAAPKYQPIQDNGAPAGTKASAPRPMPTLF